jgi:hypothetical protein
MEKIGFYYLSFLEKRKKQMDEQFAKFQINATCYHGVSHDDARVQETMKKKPGHDKPLLSIFYGHLDMIRIFAESKHEIFGIFCEDDIIIQKTYGDKLPQIIDDFKRMNLDILLMGHLCSYNYPLNEYYNPIMMSINKHHTCKYYHYPDQTWGAQMYLITKSYAFFLLNKYGNQLESWKLEIPFNPDWTLTKDGKRGLLYPPIAIEMRSNQYEGNPEDDFRKRVFENCFQEELYGPYEYIIR